MYTIFQKNLFNDIFKKLYFSDKPFQVNVKNETVRSFEFEMDCPRERSLLK